MTVTNVPLRRVPKTPPSRELRTCAFCEKMLTDPGDEWEHVRTLHVAEIMEVCRQNREAGTVTWFEVRRRR